MQKGSHCFPFSACSPSAPPKKQQIQAIAYKHIFEAGFPNDLQAHVSKHVFKMLGADADSAAQFALDDTFKAMRKLRKHEAMQVIKTWVNSWSTSDRYHEDVLLPCLLGCADKPDDLQHYIHCPRIWDITRIAFRCSCFTGFPSRHPRGNDGMLTTNCPKS